MILRNIMLWVSLLSLACSNPMFDVAKADYQASFAGSNFSGLTRQSTIMFYDSTVDDAGNYLDISGSNYLQNSEALSGTGWTVDAGATVVTDQDECPGSGGKTAELITVGTVAPPAGVQQYATLAAGQTYEIAIWVKRVSVAGTLNIMQPYASSFGLWTINLASLPDAWVRLTRTFPLVTVTNEFVVDGSNRAGMYLAADSGTIQFYACGAQVARTDGFRKGPGVYHQTTDTIKPLHDLAPSATAPAAVETSLQRSDGNRWVGRSFVAANSQNYSTAHHASFNIHTTPFTLTWVLAPSTAGAGQDDIFDHYSGSDGIWVYIDSSHKLKASMDVITVTHPTAVRDGYTHVVQLVRTAADFTFYLDGVPGVTVAVSSSYGTNNTGTLYLWGITGNYLDGTGLLFRMDAEALSQQQLVYESQRLLGFSAYSGGTSFPAHSFTRATTATNEFNNGSLATVASGIPRVTDGFMSEPLVSNVILQSQAAGTTWTPTALTSITSNVATPLAPDGTATADGLVGTADNTQHGITQDITTTAVAWTCSAYVQPGDKTWFYIANTSVANAAAYFNASNCTVGSVGAGATSEVQSMGSWCKMSIHFTGTAAAARHIQFYSALANDDNDFEGDTAAINSYVWQMECAADAAQFAAVPTTTVAVTKNADVLTIDPFKYEDYVRQGSETMAVTFDQDPTISSIDSNTAADYGAGTFTWTGTGTRIRETTERYGTYWVFNGSSTRWSQTPSASLIPDATGAGANFSIVGAIVPDTPPSTYSYVFGRYDTVGSDREYAFYLNQSGTCSLAVSHDGTNPTFATKIGTCYVAGRPLFFAATYTYSGVADAPGAVTGTSTGKLYINDMSVVNDTAFLGPVLNGSALAYIGRNTAGSYFQGKFLWLNWYKGTVLDAATIASMYDQWKQKWLIAPQMGDAGEEAKLYINFDYKLRSASASAAGDSLVEIGNSYGKSDANSNRISCAALTTTLVCSYWNDTTTATQRTITVTGLTQNTWHTVAYYVDLANLANSTMTVDGTAGTKASMSSSSSVNWRDASIHVGHDHTGAAGFANGWVKNVKVLSKP